MSVCILELQALSQSLRSNQFTIFSYNAIKRKAFEHVITYPQVTKTMCIILIALDAFFFAKISIGK